MTVQGLTKAGAFADVGFDLRAGEVLGISGLLGSGRSSLAKARFGLVAAEGGTVTVDGQAVPLGDPLAAARAGIGDVPEDRLTEGLFLMQSILRNVAIGRLDAHGPRGLLDFGGLLAEARDWLGQLRVKAPSVEAPVRSLSGGNQQRLVLARRLARSPRVLVLDGPSVGVDAGSKSDIHGIVRDLSAQGLGVIVISDDLPELIGTCHRILVMKDERITDRLAGGETSVDDLAQRLAS